MHNKKPDPQKILLRIIFNLVFTSMLFTVCYINKDGSSYNYQKEIKSVFSGHSDVENFFLMYLFKLIN